MDVKQPNINYDKLAELDWIQLRKEMDSENYIQESMGQRLVRKTKEAPLVPIGCFATVCALSYGLYSFKNGNRKMSQHMMRARVLAQGFTIAVAIASVLMTANKVKDKKIVDSNEQK